MSKKAQTLIKGKQPPKKSETNQILGIEGFYYLTERILMCPFPCNPSEGCQDDKNDEEADNTFITKIADYLNSKHQSHYLVYNLSEYKYDYSFFNQSVMEYSFPGLPCPPLDMLFMICTSIQSWLLIDPSHVVVLHC